MRCKMVDEISKQLEGKLVNISIASEGTKKDGTHYTFFKIKVKTTEGERTVGTFQDITNLMNKYIIVTYTEAENPKNPEFPFKNAINIIEGVSPAEHREANATYNLKEIGEENIEEELKNNGSFFGMVSNQSIEWIIAKKLVYQESFSKTFDTIWNENVKKRKEILNK